MEVGSLSRTAVMTAIHRAAHFLIDEPPKILADSFARAFAGFSSDKDFLAVVDSYAFPDFAAHRAGFALRNRYAEDQLAVAVASGTAQYVILGAGLDSFAYRRPDSLRGLQIFEIDHPTSQAWKRARVAELGTEAPPNLRYVSIDFECETLSARLDAGGVDRKAKAFFSWLGVTRRSENPAGDSVGHRGGDRNRCHFCCACLNTQSSRGRASRGYCRAVSECWRTLAQPPGTRGDDRLDGAGRVRGRLLLRS
jgi:O-methyltransferase involved in polyketide biosynthesis